MSFSDFGFRISDFGLGVMAVASLFRNRRSLIIRNPKSRPVPVPRADPVHEAALLVGERLLPLTVDLVEQLVHPRLVEGALLGLALGAAFAAGLQPALDGP